jgi:hypothetical protein
MLKKTEDGDYKREKNTFVIGSCRQYPTVSLTQNFINPQLTFQEHLHDQKIGV